MSSTDLSVIVPAHQEEARIDACLGALCAQALPPGARPELLVVPNGCTDRTAEIARAWTDRFKAAGWRMAVLETPVGGKIAALNLAEAQAAGPSRLFLDADVVIGEGMLLALYVALAGPGARYVGARLTIPAPRSRISAAYARFWQALPFVAENVTGAGLFAVNAEGRARWDVFPDIIADDAFVRLLFNRSERTRVEVPYLWPVTEGFQRLVRVRRRQNAGNSELSAVYPELAARSAGDSPTGRWLVKAALRDPVGFAVYSGVALAVRARRPSGKWDRGR